MRTAPHEPTTVSSKATIRRFGSAAERAIVATAHKLLRVVYCVLRTGKPYRDPDYEAMMVKRNAPRWIRMLETYNIIEQDDEGRMRIKQPRRARTLRAA